MDGNDELKELTQLLRIGLETVRKIAQHRPDDYDQLIDISNRSEAMANELDELTARYERKRQIQ